MERADERADEPADERAAARTSQTYRHRHRHRTFFVDHGVSGDGASDILLFCAAVEVAKTRTLDQRPILDRQRAVETRRIRYRVIPIVQVGQLAFDNFPVVVASRRKGYLKNEKKPGEGQVESRGRAGEGV